MPFFAKYRMLNNGSKFQLGFKHLRGQSAPVRIFLTLAAVFAGLVVMNYLPFTGDIHNLLIINFSLVLTAIFLGVDCGILAALFVLLVLNRYFLWNSWIENPSKTLLINLEFVAITGTYLLIIRHFTRINVILRQNEQDLYYAQNIGQIGSWRLVPQQHEIIWSEEIRRIFEVPDDIPMTYAAYLAALHPDDRAVADQQWQAALRGEPYDTKHRIIVRGKIKWVREKAVLEFGKKGELLGGFGIIQDITGQMEKEQALQHQLELQDQLVKVAESVPGVICSFRLDPDGNASMPYASPFVESLYGIKFETIKDDFAPVFNRISPEDIGHVQATINSSAQSFEPWHDTFRYQHPIKGEIWIEGHSVPLREANGSILWHGYIQDVTTRVHDEQKYIKLNQELKRKIEEMQVIFDTAPIGIAVANDTTGLHIRGNKINEKIFGLPSGSELSKRSENAANIKIFQGNRELTVDQLPMQRAIKGEIISNFLLTCQRPDNTTITMLCNAKPLLDNNGVPRGAVGAFLDVSELIKTKEFLILQGKIDKKIHEQVALQTAGMIAHELNQPLTAITYYADAAVNMLTTPSFNSEKLREILEKCSLQTQRVGAIFNELTDFLCKGEIAAESFDLNHCIQETVDLYKTQEQLNYNNIKLNLAANLPYVCANKMQTIKVLMQLLRNGFDAQLKTGLSPPQVTITSTFHDQDSNTAQVIVRDYGTGLGNNDNLESIFQPFHTDKPDSLGLGLTISRAVIEVNGGKLWAEKNVDQGLSFYFTLPLISPP